MGKTVVTAAVAALASGRGERVAVVKPAQTGVARGEPGDLAEVTRLTGVADTHEFARFPGPLSPEAAARISGLPPADLAQAARDVRALAGCWSGTGPTGPRWRTWPASLPLRYSW